MNDEKNTRYVRVISVLAFCGVTLAVNGLLRMLPDTAIAPVFCHIPARLTAGYYNAPLQTPELVFIAHGTTFEVARSCAATDFFSMVTGLLAYGVFTKVAQTRMPVLPSALLFLCILPAAWCVTLITNTIRLIFLVPATTWVYHYLPERAFAASHQALGTIIFLTSFILLWKGVHYVTRKSAT